MKSKNYIKCNMGIVSQFFGTVQSICDVDFGCHENWEAYAGKGDKESIFPK